jgi:ribonuclease D
MRDLTMTRIAAMIRNDTAPTRSELIRTQGFNLPETRRHRTAWKDAINRAMALPEKELPPSRPKQDHSANPRNWERHHPEAFARWKTLRPAINELAENLNLPAENLISPAVLRELAWAPPSSPDPDSVDAALAALEARAWQRELLDDLIAGLLGQL